MIVLRATLGLIQVGKNKNGSVIMDKFSSNHPIMFNSTRNKDAVVLFST